MQQRNEPQLVPFTPGVGPPPRRRLLTVPEVAAELRISERSVYYLIQDGYLRALRSTRGRAIYQIDAEDVQRYIEELKQGMW